MKNLMRILPKNSGRSGGKVTVRHQGGRMKRFLREVDFGRQKHDIWAKAESIEYDPNRNANVALVVYEDGERSYILAPTDLKVGGKVIASEMAPLEPGNALPLKKIPVGTAIHNLEIRPGKGGQLVKSGGSSAIVQGKEEDWVLVKLPSAEIRRFDPEAWATVGQVSRDATRTGRIKNAGVNRRLGIRPTVRGKAMNPSAHPHGGGEGRSPVGLKYPKTPWGKSAVGKTRKRRKYSDKLIVQGRKRGRHAGGK